MIQSNELRIGNFLADSLTGAYLVVTELSKISIVTKLINSSLYPLPDGWQIQPIPLTPEILEKCGFKKVGYYWTINDVVSFKWYNDSMRRFVLSDNEINEGRNLHQLQNLYFALTGKELEVSL